MMAIGTGSEIKQSDGWVYLPSSVRLASSLKAHLVFALKYEGVNLLILKKLFERLSSKEVEAIVIDGITGHYSRRIWFLYEWLMDQRLNIADTNQGNYTSVLNPTMQYAVTGTRSSRHRIINNLPGTPAFCPLVFKTPELRSYETLKLKEEAASILASIPEDPINRVQLLLTHREARSSFTIESESPDAQRLNRWAQVLGEAGRTPLSKEELLRLQELVLGQSILINLGFRKEGGFVGDHDRITGFPIVEHVSSRSEDVESLVGGILAYDQGGEIDPVIAAAAISFGFVQVHPFSDGNGRIHRYLIHHILAEREYTPPGIIFPISHAMLNRVSDYKKVLRASSFSILPFIEWDVTPDYNVRVLNDTADYYRYFDATQYALFLYQCVEETIEYDLIEEAAYLQAYDSFRIKVQALIEMPDRMVHLLYRFLRQNNGTLTRSKEFKEVPADIAQEIEVMYQTVFG